MATYYVSSVDGDNADDGTTWDLAKATVAGALAVATGAFDIIKVDSNHAFTAGGGIGWTVNSTSFVAVISVNRTGSDAYLAGAAESVGAANANFNLNPGGSLGIYVYGMTLTSGTNNNTACDFNIGTMATGATSITTMESCTLSCPSAANNALFFLGGAANTGDRENQITLTNCTFTRTSAEQAFEIRNAAVRIVNPTINTGSTGTLFTFSVNTEGSLFVEGDISGFTGSTGICLVTGCYLDVTFQNCKFPVTTPLYTGTFPANEVQGSITVINSDSADTHDQFQFHNVKGSITRNTSIYASSGATVDGTACSWKIVTTAEASEQAPFVTPWLATWDDSKTAITATIEYNHDDATDSNDREIWSELEYLGSASFPNGTINSNRNAEPFTGTGATTGTGAATWTGTGGFTDENVQKLSHSVTTAEKSVMRARVFVGEASKTLYLDPTIRIA